jgi:hypothetical protein
LTPAKLDDAGQALVRRLLGDSVSIEVDGLKLQSPSTVDGCSIT